MTTFANLLLARRDDPHPGVRSTQAELSWAQVVEAASTRAALATALRRPGPFHVGVMLENTPDYVAWIGAAALAGATVVGVNTTRRGEHLAADIRHTDCQLLVTDSGLAPLLDGLDTGVPPDRVLRVDGPSYRALLAAHAGGEVPGTPQAEQPLLLLFTSGSTGAPKAVVCTQGRLAAIAGRSAQLFELTRDDVLYESMPLFHGNAVMANLAPAVGVGATVALRRRFSASAFLPDVRRYGATYFNYVGRALAYVLATRPAPDDADNPLRLGFGTEASARDRAQFERRFGCRILETYGSSEGVISMHRPVGTPPASLGVPTQPGADVAIVDPHTGRECPRADFDAHGGLRNPGEAIGEIVNRAGAASFEGYYRNEEASAARLRRGWYWSGDLGYRDADGWFYFAGRDDDWLRVDSENFAAAPVEAILARHRDLVMVAVYAVPDARTGDQVMAAVELAEGHGFDADRFARFLAAQPDLGTTWAPRFVRVVEAMPLTATGKVRKRPLRVASWETTDPVWWRPGRDLTYRPFTASDAAALHEQFLVNGRRHLLSAARPGPGYPVTRGRPAGEESRAGRSPRAASPSP